MELTFSTAAHTVQCFGSVAPAVLTTPQCFGWCSAVLAQCQGHLCFPLHPHSQAEGGREPGTRHSWDSESPNRYFMWCILKFRNKNWKKKKMGGCFGFQSGCLETGWALLCLWEVVPSPLPHLFPSTPFFSSLIKLFFISTAEFSQFRFFLFSPHCEELLQGVSALLAGVRCG